jgi:hypothetical protein
VRPSASEIGLEVVFVPPVTMNVSFVNVGIAPQ